MNETDTVSTRSTISQQSSTKWMQAPDGVKGEYPGLAYITDVGELIVAEKRDALHRLIDDQTRVGYTVYNNEGQKVFLGILDKSQCRKYRVLFFNNYGNEVIEVKRRYSMFLNVVLVWAPPGHFVGSVVQKRPCIKTYFVKNRNGKKILKIRLHRQFKFKYEVMSADGKIGVFMNEWRLKEVRDVKNVGVTFPANLNCGVKATLLGASFLIGFLKHHGETYCECDEAVKRLRQQS